MRRLINIAKIISSRILTNKRKIINDPVWGFISIPDALCFDVIEHRYFQRLRRIKQLGLTHLVYPGALHTRFHHSLGAMHLMGQALQVLQAKGVEICAEEAQAVTLAILLHDLGHGPFSHALETTIVSGITHEEFTDLFLESLIHEFDDRLTLALAMFRDTYGRKFFGRMISGQLDMDRLDYLRRDSFFTGVSEGKVGSERIIKMLNVHGDDLVTEEKGLLSVEHFLSSRRTMYWQVYLHKTVLAAETLLISILKRAQYLARNGENLFATRHFLRFLQNSYTRSDFCNDPTLLDSFARIDDFDVFSSIKAWTEHPDPVLSLLSRYLVDRRLFGITFSERPVSPDVLVDLQIRAEEKLRLASGQGQYFVSCGSVATTAYDRDAGPILVNTAQNGPVEFTRLLPSHLRPFYTHTEERHFVCYPKGLLTDGPGIP